ncbi:hypothetical protein MYX78_13400 [Acidobacteria bacterium AH-259-G07]|nr:hypothetical protein [Acidobacteria bacterium AH-259-G07]
MPLLGCYKELSWSEHKKPDIAFQVVFSFPTLKIEPITKPAWNYVPRSVLTKRGT